MNLIVLVSFLILYLFDWLQILGFFSILLYWYVAEQN